MSRGSIHHHVNAAFIFFDYRKRAPRRLQQGCQFGFDKPALLIGIANVSEWWAHVKRAAGLAFREHVVSTQMDLGSLTCRAQLLQMPIAKFAFGILFVADGLRIGDALRHLRRRGRSSIWFWIGNSC